jgi:hypothetical protein
MPYSQFVLTIRSGYPKPTYYFLLLYQCRKTLVSASLPSVFHHPIFYCLRRFY